jgi:rhodanese-related sulfurtransferase
MDTAQQPQSLAISPEQLAARLRAGNPPLVLDVRRMPRYLASDRMLQGAQYCPPDDVAAYAKAHAPREVVVYCVYGHEVGKDSAAALKAAGWDAKYLAGGIEGGEDGVDNAEQTGAWRAVQIPSVAKKAGEAA